METAITPAEITDLVELLRFRATHQPDKTAFIFLKDGETEEGRLTYRELDFRAKEIALQLRKAGTVGERALLLYPPGLEYIAAFFGCLYAGVIAVPAYPPNPARLDRTLPRLAGIINSAKPLVAMTTWMISTIGKPLFSKEPAFRSVKWLATDSISIGKKISDMPILNKLVFLKKLFGISDPDSAWKKPDITPDSLAFLQYTSGSTGDPKGVMVSHGNLMYNFRLIHECTDDTPDICGVSWLPPYHDMGLIGGILQSVYGCFTMVLMSPIAFLQKPFRWLAAMSRYKAYGSAGPNFAYDLCARKVTAEQRAQLDLSHWKIAYNGAEPLRPETLERFSDAFASSGFRKSTFYPCYGLAEGTLFASGGSIDVLPILRNIDRSELSKHHRAVSPENTTSDNIHPLIGCGKTLTGQQIVIVNPDTLKKCDDNEVGEIWLSGPSMAKGYWEKPEATEETFHAYISDTREGPFLRTGDLGFVSDGELFVTGRRKDLIIIRGRNHYPQDIELSVEKSYPNIRPGCVAAFSVEIDGEERLMIAAEIERRHKERRQVPDQKPDERRTSAERRQVDIVPGYEPDKPVPVNMDTAIEEIRKAVSEHHELQVYGILLLKVGTIPKTSSGKIQRHACRNGFLKNSLDIVGKSVLEEVESAKCKVQSVETVAAPEISLPSLASASAEERQKVLESYFCALIAEVAKVPLSYVKASQSLSSLGIDSLMAIEIQHRIESDLGLNWQMTMFLDNPTIAQLVDEAVQSAKCKVQSVTTDSADAGKAQIEISQPSVSEFPLSYNQQSLWFMYQLAPESSAYNVFYAIRIVSPPDIPSLWRAFESLIARHPVLRTTYHLKDGVPVQQIHNTLPLRFEITNAALWSEEELNNRIAEQAHLPFDLENGPVLRVSLFVRSPEDHVLLLNIHHIATDLWSFSVFADELQALYVSETSRHPSVLNPQPLVLYTDYARWQAEMLSGAEGERLWSYWKQKLGGELPVLNLPTDHPRPPVQTYNGLSHYFKVNGKLTQKIRDLSKESGTTLFMTLMAAFQVLLYRYTGQKDIVVGSPAAARSRRNFERIMGYFVNPIVLRSDLSGKPSFRKFLSQVRQTVLEALEHQQYPFQLLVERLQQHRDPSRSPLFQALFVLQKAYPFELPAPFIMNEEGGQMQMGNLNIRSYKFEHRFAQFDLTLFMAEDDGALSAYFEYNKDLFNADTISRMAIHFQVLLDAIVYNPDMDIASLPILTYAELEKILVAWNNTKAEYPYDKCLHQLFEEQVEKTPDVVAVVFEDQEMSYRELNARANQLAHYLIKQGVKPETLVGIYMDRSLEIVVGLFGILKAGGAYIPLDPSYPKERLSFMIQDAGIQIVLTQEKFVGELSEYSLQTVCLNPTWDAIVQEHRENPKTEVKPDNLIYVIYTSGSTGKPKGVAIEHYSVINLLTGLYGAIYSSLPSLLRVSLNGPLAFDTSVKQLIQLLHGHAVIIIPEALRFDGKALMSYIHRHHVEVFDCTPSQLRLLLLAGLLDESEPALKAVLIGGEAIDELTWKQLKQSEHIDFYNLYGPTECTVDATICNIRTGHYKPVIGRPITNTQIYIFDDNFETLPIGIAGELYISGDGLARGYFNDPDMTEKKFISHPFYEDYGAHDIRLYKTGDKARYLWDGNIEFLGRIDEQVKLRGFRIELGEIEALIKTHPYTQDAAVVVREDHPGNKRLVAYVVPKPFYSPVIDGRERYKLPNNLAIFHLNKNETDFLYKEMFEVRAYLKHGITIHDGDCIVDVGTNIGLFTLSAHFCAKNLKFYGFDPNPFVFEILRLNTSLYGVDAKLYDCGLSDRTQTADFTFYPGFSILSGLYADENEEKEVVRSFILKQQQALQKDSAVSMQDSSLEDILSEKFRSRTFAVQLRTLSDIIEENNIGQIDLLKINVEKSELDVLSGIGEKNWQKIRQIAMEVHDIDGRLDQVKELLKKQGYHLSVEQDWSLETTSKTNYYIYAIREPESHSSSVVAEKKPLQFPEPFLSGGDLRDFLEKKLPEYMIPSSYAILERLPVTPNGKIDKRALPDPEIYRQVSAMPETDIEQKIAAIWQELLHLNPIGIRDNFFDLGGHSLLLIQVQTRLQEVFNREIPVVELFKYPTIAALAEYLSERGKDHEEEASAIKQVQDRASRQKEAMRRRKQSKKEDD